MREGDILLPTVAREMQARVATDADAGAFPTAGLHHLRITDRELVDPWYLASYLSSAEGTRQAASVTSTMGLPARIDPRRVRVPLPPIEQQRGFGEAFRSLAAFADAPRAVDNLGRRLVRASTDALAAELRAHHGVEMHSSGR
ncbi:hypothetical protein ACFWOX_33210 [Streptomyces sp. NPDC058467]|uniref:hypothetical protein n=1 Tax=unclassified Streptomyces TaxID=2593676 RepID=UPI0036643BAE